MEHHNLGRHTVPTVHPSVLPTLQSGKVHSAHSTPSGSANITNWEGTQCLQYTLQFCQHHNLGRYTVPTVHPPVLPTSQSGKAHSAYSTRSSSANITISEGTQRLKPTSSSANITMQRLFSDESTTWPFHFFKPRRNILYNRSVSTFDNQFMRMNFKNQFPLMFPNLYHLLFSLLTFPSGFQTKIFYKFAVSQACYMNHQARPPKICRNP
jgi:hypothetical protein